MTDRDKRLLIAAAIALLAFVVVGRLAALGGEESDTNAGVGARDGGVPSVFRGGALPPGISGAPAPRFVLDDARGGQVDTRRLRGRPYVVTFLYVACKDVCPLIGAELKQALERLGPDAEEVTMIAVSADPHGDTRAAVRRWLARLRMPANFRYLIGSDAQLRLVWRSHYAAGQPRDRANSAHTASIWLVDRRGRWRTKFSGGMAVAPADIAHDLRLLLDEHA